MALVCPYGRLSALGRLSVWGWRGVRGPVTSSARRAGVGGGGVRRHVRCADCKCDRAGNVTFGAPILQKRRECVLDVVRRAILYL